MSSLLIFSCDKFYVSDERLWSSPIASASQRLFADNFDDVTITVPFHGVNPDKLTLIPFPRHWKIEPLRPATGIKQRLSQFRHIISYLNKEASNFDIIYIRMFSFEALPAAIWCSLFRKKNWFMSLHGDIEEALLISRRDKNPLLRTVSAKIFGLISRLITIRPEILFTSGPVLGRKYANGRPFFPFMDSGITDADIFNERQDTCQAPPYKLLHVGQISARKGIDHLFRAIAILRKRSVPVVLDLIGSGDVDWALSSAQEIGVSDHIRFRGYIRYGSELFREIRNADVVVVPSVGSEGWNRVITESNAQGVPIVASDINSLGVAIDEGHCGIKAKPGDSLSLANAIQYIIDHPNERRRMIKGGLARGRHYVYSKEFMRMRELLSARYKHLLTNVDNVDLTQAGRSPS